MYLSKLFLPLLKETPSEAKIKSHQLMLRAGMIKQSSTGIYSWLPLGFKVMKKIEQIVREEQNKIGAQELLMPTIQSAEIWKESGRYEDYGEEMLRIKDRQGKEMLYGPTNEELITEIFRTSVKSYNKMFFAYLKTFKRLGLTAIPMAADAGPIGGDLSHEFVILADTGESKIYSDKRIFDIDISKHDSEDNSIKDLRKKYDEFYAVTDDKYKKEDFEKKVKKENQLVTKGIEVGHIFYFGDKYSKSLKCSVDLKDGKKVNVKMGSYGVGVSRLVGAIIEAKFNNNIMKWPESVSPFDVVIIPSLQKNDKSNYLKAEKIYKFLLKDKIDVLFDDTDEHLSAKFKKFDLIGIPYQIVLGSKSGDYKFEFKEINEKTESLSLEEIKNKLLNRRN